MLKMSLPPSILLPGPLVGSTPPAPPSTPNIKNDASNLMPPPSFLPTNAAANRKRDRHEDYQVDNYLKNKKVLQEGFLAMKLSDYGANASGPPMPISSQFYSYDTYEVHESCPSHEMFRKDSEDSTLSMQTVPTTIDRRNSVESTNSDQSSDSETPRLAISTADSDPTQEAFVSIVKGGTQKYLRKVDYLVDELIRKSRKTAIPTVSTNEDFHIPDYVGPSPRTDSILVPFSTEFCSLSKRQENEMEENDSQGVQHDLSTARLLLLPPPPPTSSSLLSVDAATTHYYGKESTDNRLLGPLPPILHSGEITHGDWGIEEIAMASIADEGSMEEESIVETDGGGAFDGQRSEDSSSKADIDESCRPVAPFPYQKRQHSFRDCISTDVSLDGNESDMACCEEWSQGMESSDGDSSNDDLDTLAVLADSDDETLMTSDSSRRRSPWSTGMLSPNSRQSKGLSTNAAGSSRSRSAGRSRSVKPMTSPVVSISMTTPVRSVLDSPVRSSLLDSVGSASGVNRSIFMQGKPSSRSDHRSATSPIVNQPFQTPFSSHQLHGTIDSQTGVIGPVQFLSTSTEDDEEVEQIGIF